jgi:hypothetical protein
VDLKIQIENQWWNKTEPIWLTAKNQVYTSTFQIYFSQVLNEFKIGLENWFFFLGGQQYSK